MYAPRNTKSSGRRIAAPPRKSPRLLLALLAAAASVAAGEPASETWYRVDVSGQPAGWAMESEASRGEEIVTESKMHLELSRNAAAATIEMESRFVETRQGRPVSARTTQKLGAEPLETDYEFRDDGIVVRHRQASGEEREEVVALPEGEWLTPGEVRRRIRGEIARGAEALTFRSLDLALGLEPVTSEWTLVKAGQEVLTSAGVHRTALWRQTQSFAPQLATFAHLDGEGLLVRSETKLMGLEMTLTLAARDEVLGAPTAAPEILVRTFIRPDRGIERPRQARRAVYEIRAGGAPVPELPSVGAQRAEALGTRARVTVDLGSGGEADAGARAELLRSTPYLPHDDPLIRELLERALRRAGPEPWPSDAERALAIRAFVAGYLVDKDLDTVLGTAAEVAATRSGDCTEHSVLLAALLRAAGIPSRVVSGLVYVESFAGAADIFAFHMWTQALVEGRWLDLDATLSGEPFDAAHIAFAVSSLDGGQSVLRDMARILPLLGGLDVRVLDVGYP